MLLQGTVEVGPIVVGETDLLRLLTLPVFAWATWKDVLTRRIPGIVWTPLTLLGLGLLVVDLQAKMAGDTYTGDFYVFTTAIGLGLIVSLAILFHYIGGFGGADARAFMTIAVLFPFYPSLVVFGTELPVVESTLPVFSFTILVNTVLWGIFYPVFLAIGNAVSGRFGRKMFVGIETDVTEIERTYGKLLDRRGHDSLWDRLHTIVVPRRRGLDLDALRMYLRWRGLTLEEVRSDPDHYRRPESLPADRNDPTDGSVVDDVETDGGTDQSGPPAVTTTGSDASGEVVEGSESSSGDDPWGANTFLEEIDGSAYGTSAETLRHGLTTLSERDRVWVSPGIPFLVPVFIGIVVSYLLGDTLVVVLRLAGLL